MKYVFVSSMPPMTVLVLPMSIAKIIGGTPFNHIGCMLSLIHILEIWQFGSSMVLFLSALKQVPQSLYEAARIDGCLLYTSRCV